jgi:pyrimidine-nucleoside phosphorylase
LDYQAGIKIVKKTGDKVKEGEVIATLYSQKPQTLPDGIQNYLQALTFGSNEPEPEKLVFDFLK